MDLAQLRRAWPQTGAWLGEPAPLTRGTNNLMYRVETATGSYALRVAGAQVDERRLAFECDILARLGAAGLPFALPMPLTTARGARWLRLADAGDAGAVSLATLTALIAGAHPQRDDLAQAAGAGEALGRLDEALAALRLEGPELGIDWRSTGDLSRCHPLVPDPRAAIGALPLLAEETRRLIARYEAVMAASAPLYANLPRQLSHEDFDPSNLLMVGDQVSGVLDWEFCAVDLRAMDLVVALTWWPVEHFGSGDEWPILAALARGYGRARTLDHAEVATIPTLFRLRAYTSLIHRLGRWRAGLSPLEDVLWRARAALERDDWLRANGERLSQLVGEALHGRADGALG